MKLIEGIYLLLGSNLGKKKENLARAIKELELSDIKISKKSSIYETDAWGKTDQASFYNQVIQIETFLEANALLNTLLFIEKKMGRIRKEHWGERLIDIDILYYHDLIIDSRHLKIPHPGIPERRFTLIPLVEIAQNLIHPIFNVNQLTLLQNCDNSLSVRKIS